ncbi:MAG: hypothetical protein JO130_18645 [Solirubrobacterales bacterium]|nr:hypothetical protein [Solirubrobacterales bacterium]
MTVETPAFAAQSGSYGAEQTRRAIASLLARGSSVGSITGGLVNSADMQITAGGGMSVNVGTGEAWVPGTSGSTQGGYYCRVSSSTNLLLAASNPSNPRIDSVTATVTDAAYGQSSTAFAVQMNTGTPTSGASLTNLSGAPATPTSSLVIGYVLVPANASSIVTGDILQSAPRILPSTALASKGVLASLPSPGVFGRTFYATDVSRFYFDTGTAWEMALAAGPWTMLTLGTAVVAATPPRVRLEGDIVKFSGTVYNSGGVGTGATVVGGIPSALAPPQSILLDAVVASGGAAGTIQLEIVSGGTSIIVDGTGPAWPSGDYLSLEGKSYPLT